MFSRLSLLRVAAGGSAAREIRATAAETGIKRGAERGTVSEHLVEKEQSALGMLEVRNWWLRVDGYFSVVHGLTNETCPRLCLVVTDRIFCWCKGADSVRFHCNYIAQVEDTVPPACLPACLHLARLAA